MNIRRNEITIIDRDVPKITIKSLLPGDMFRYPKSSHANNVYMVCQPNWKDDITVILLATGQRYADFDRDRPVEVIDAVSIVR